MIADIIPFPMQDAKKPHQGEPDPSAQPFTEDPDCPVFEVKDFDSLPDEMPAELIQGLLRKTEMMLLAAKAKKRKSWVLMDLLFCVANGLPWLGFKTFQASVLHVDMELLEPDMKGRFRLIANSYKQGSPDKIKFISLRGANMRLQHLEALKRAIPEDGCDLFSLDPTYRLLGGRDDCAAGVITDLLNHFLNLGMSLEAAVLLLQHYAKGDATQKDPQERISGSGVWARYPDTVMTFTENAEKPDSFTVDFSLRSFAPIESFVVYWDFPRFRILEGGDPEKLKEPRGRPKLSSAAQLASLLGSGEEISYKDFETRVCALCHISPKTFERRLKDAVSQQLLFQSKMNGKYSLTSAAQKKRDQ